MNSERKTAIVTGAGRGLGRAMAVCLLDKGNCVVAMDCDKEPLDLLAAPYGAPQLATVDQDLPAPEAEERVCATSLSAFGRIDILVNNAGMGQSVVWPDHWVNPLRVWNIELEQWKRFFELNTHVTFGMSKMVVAPMMEQRCGRIINWNESAK